MQNRAFSVVGPIVLSTLPWELYPFPRLCSHTFYGHQKIFCPSWSWECSCFRVVMDCSIQILMNEWIFGASWFFAIYRKEVRSKTENLFIHSGYFYSASSSPLPTQHRYHVGV